MINPEIRDVEAERGVLTFILPDARVIVQDFVAQNPAFQSNCVFNDHGPRPRILLEIWRPNMHTLNTEEQKSIATCVLRIVQLKPPGELEYVRSLHPMGVAYFRITSNAKTIVRKGPEHGPEKVY
ncbi:MAG: hypothetical protein AAB343_01350 [Patescibacteria group bacterium]